LFGRAIGFIISQSIERGARSKMLGAVLLVFVSDPARMRPKHISPDNTKP